MSWLDHHYKLQLRDYFLHWTLHPVLYEFPVWACQEYPCHPAYRHQRHDSTMYTTLCWSTWEEGAGSENKKPTYILPRHSQNPIENHLLRVSCWYTSYPHEHLKIHLSAHLLQHLGQRWLLPWILVEPASIEAPLSNWDVIFFTVKKILPSVLSSRISS